MTPVNEAPPALWCDCEVPFSCILQAEPVDTHAQMLLLQAINQIESAHETEPVNADSRRLERLEAKLDLTLFLLARTLEPSPPGPPHNVRLLPEGLIWQESSPASRPEPGARVTLALRPSTALPLTLKLSAEVSEVRATEIQTSFTHLDEDTLEAWHQLVFRRHRQAIRARR